MKRIKDPIYGYISIPREIVKSIIDTAEFQRLRYIRQTSYLPVYPSALHNRFTHSLGVYYLGTLAFDSIESSYNDLGIIIDGVDIKRIRKIFTLSCLLHDIGHAPFSHSGESFYLDSPHSLDNELLDKVNDKQFEKDLKETHNKTKIAAPHEIMSVILSLKQFGVLFHTSEERSLFARCITGYTFTNSVNDTKTSFYNAIISLLNSSTIDVDRLDYLIRDAFVMGYNSISIDYKRLLSGITIIKDNNNYINLAFNKSALSVIENVIYAHDSEKKWIQNHPVILYETYLIQHIIRDVNEFYKKNTNLNLFTLESLLPEKTNEHGNNAESCFEKIVGNLSDVESCSEEVETIRNALKNNGFLSKISLMCDDDIIFLSKYIHSDFCKELYNRNLRRSPIWKSESEYSIFLDGFVGDDSFEELQKQLKVVEKFLVEESPTHILDEESKKYCEEKINELKTIELDDPDKVVMNSRYTLLLNWLNCFKKIHEDQKIDFDFVIIQAKKFESSFNKEELRKLLIYFPTSQKSYPLEKLINLFSSKENSRREYFYIYYKKNDSQQLNIEKVGKEIAKLILQ